MSYAVKEVFLTLQGEGAQAGRTAVFLRFSGCNLWSGREEDRATAQCPFCDTDFRGTDGTFGGRYETAVELSALVAGFWPAGAGNRLVVCTGGEPLLQLDAELLAALHREGFQVAVESNGTRPAPEGIDWLTISPKAGAPWVQRSGDELKLVFPQPELHPDGVATEGFRHLFLQPMDGPRQAENTRAAVDYCLANPRWRLSVQTHKVLGLR